jgi:AcrR family transcriptional regulator
LRQAAAAETRSRILAAACSLLAGDEAAAFTVDAIAEKANVARMTVYNQFRSKRGLIEALSDEIAEQGGIGRLAKAFADPDPMAGLHAVIQVFVGFWESQRLVLRRLRAVLALDPELADANRDSRRRDAIRSALERVRAGTGRPARAEIERIADTLWVLTGFEAFEHLASRDMTALEITDMIFENARRSLDASA